MKKYFVLCLVLLTASVWADYKWVGDVDDNWHNGANWEGGSVPASDDQVNVSGSYVPGTSYDPVVHTGNAATGERLQFKNYYDAMPVGTPFSLTIQDGASLTCGGGYNMWGAWYLDATMYIEEGATVDFIDNASFHLGQHYGSKGTVHTSGNVDCGSIHIGPPADYGNPADGETLGKLYIEGGSVYAYWEIKVYPNNPESEFNITGGQAIVRGNWLDRYYEYLLDGRLTGTTFSKVIYDGTDTIIDPLIYEANQATEPDPALNEKGVQLNKQFGWTAAQGAVEHDVYLSTDLTEVLGTDRTSAGYMGKVAGTAFGLQEPNMLEPTTVYYWRVDGLEDPCSSVIANGEVWFFETGDGAPADCAEALSQGYSQTGDFNSDCYAKLGDLDYMANVWLDCMDPVGENCDEPWSDTSDPNVIPDLLHRWSFESDGTDSVGGANASLMGQALITDGALDLTDNVNMSINPDDPNTFGDPADPHASWAELPIQTTLNNLPAVTVEVWFKWQGDGPLLDNSRVVFGFGDSGTEDQIELYPGTQWGAIARVISVSTGNDSQIWTNPIGENDWHHAVVSYKTGDPVHYYLDGTEVTTNLYENGFRLQLNSIINFENCFLGRKSNTATTQFAFLVGMIDEVRIYDYYMNPEKVAESYFFGPDTVGPATCTGALNYNYGILQDLNGDCYVNLKDIALFTSVWLDCIDPTDDNCDTPWF